MNNDHWAACVGFAVGIVLATLFILGIDLWMGLAFDPSL